MKAKWVVLGVALALFAGAGALVSYAVIRQPEGTFSQVLTAVSGSVGTISLFAISGLLYAIAHDREPQQVLFTVLLAMTSGVLIGAATGPLLSIPTALRIPVTVTSVVITNAFFIPLAIWVW